MVPLPCEIRSKIPLEKTGFKLLRSDLILLWQIPNTSIVLVHINWIYACSVCCVAVYQIEALSHLVGLDNIY